MRKVVQTALVVSSFVTSVFAMEFGTMGSQAFGMGGAGVAVKRSPWGLYYNPALIASEDALKFGLYAGAQAKGLKNLKKFEINPSSVTLEDLVNLQNFFRETEISARSQLGLVLQTPDLGLGALSFGAFGYVSASGSAKIENIDINALIQQNPPVIPPNIPDIDNLLEGQFSIVALSELPLGYAHKFDGPLGDLSVGVAVKYMVLAGHTLGFGEDFSFADQLKKFVSGKLPQAENVGVDVGLTYEPSSFLTLAVVGKNLNAPEFDLGTQKITIKPQARAGVALNADLLTLALDADLMPNEFLGSKIKTQMLSVGGALDLSFFALRVGVAKDLQIKDDLIYSLGVGFLIFDGGVQFGKKTDPVTGLSSDHLAVQLGLGFSF